MRANVDIISLDSFIPILGFVKCFLPVTESVLRPDLISVCRNAAARPLPFPGIGVPPLESRRSLTLSFSILFSVCLSLFLFVLLSFALSIYAMCVDCCWLARCQSIVVIFVCIYLPRQ